MVGETSVYSWRDIEINERKTKVAPHLTLKRVRKRRGTKRTDLKTEQRAWNCARSCLYATASMRAYILLRIHLRFYAPVHARPMYR